MEQDRSTRRRFLQGLGAGTVVSLTGCLGDDGGGSGDSAAEIAIVYPVAGLGDQGFSDDAQRGLERAREELDISFDEGEPNDDGEYADFHNDFAAEGYDLIIGLTFDQVTPIENVSADFPDQNWSIIDAAVQERDNVASVVFKEHEGCYLAGWLAGRLSVEGFEAGDVSAPGNGTVGFVGGVRNPVIEKFHAGFKAGVEDVEGDTELVSSYAGGFGDPSTGQSIANSMYGDQDADVIFHAAGGTGLGVFEAAQEAGRPAIGVDTDQSVTAEDFSDVIVASMLKRMNAAVYDTVESVVNDNWEATTEELGLEAGGHEIVYGQDIGDAVPDEIKEEVDEKRQAIIDGDIEPPRTLDE